MDGNRHLSAQDALRFLRTELSRQESRNAVRHLLKCEECRSLVLEAKGNLDIPLIVPVAPLTHLDISTPELEHRIRRERQLAAVRFDELMTEGTTFRDRVAAVNNGVNLGLGLWERFMKEAHSLRSKPRAMREMAYLSLLAGRRVRVKDYGRQKRQDVLAESSIELANAYRILEDFPRCRLYLDAVPALLERGSGDIHIEARYLSILGSYLADTGRLEEAESILKRESAIWYSLGESILYARSLIKRAGFLRYKSPDRGLELATKAIKQLKELRDGEVYCDDVLYCCAAHTQIDLILQSGHTGRAHMMFLRFESLFVEVEDSKHWNLIRYLAARIAGAVGLEGKSEIHIREAIKLFLEVIEGFAANGNRQESAMASVDLVLLYVKCERQHAARVQLLETISLSGLPDYIRDLLVATHGTLLDEAIEREAIIEMVTKAREEVARHWKHQQ